MSFYKLKISIIVFFLLCLFEILLFPSTYRIFVITIIYELQFLKFFVIFKMYFRLHPWMNEWKVISMGRINAYILCECIDFSYFWRRLMFYAYSYSNFYANKIYLRSKSVAYGPEILSYSKRNLNKLSIKYQSNPKSWKIDLLRTKICFLTEIYGA